MSESSPALRRLIVVVGAAVLLDTTFLAVVAPLLPGLTHELHLSKLGAGILTGSYPAGMLLASIPGAVLSVRRGPRVAICAGLGLFVVATVAFAVLHSAPDLDLARFVEGVGGACSWAGGLAWLMALAPVGRRGSVIGRAMSAAIVGAVAGPAVGSIAAGVGRGVLFLMLAGIGLVLGAVTWRLRVPDDPGRRIGPAPGRAGRPLAPALGDLLRRPMGRAALWLMALPAIVSGALDVLGPLRLHPLGAGAGVIGATFLAAAALETAVSAWVGRTSDRLGRGVPLAGSLVVAGTGIACFGVPSSVAVLIGVIIVADGGVGTALTPAMALLADLADSVGLDQALGAGLMNVAWAAGQIVGSAGGGAAARLTDDTLTTVILGGACLISAAVVLRRHAALDTGRAEPSRAD